MSKYLPVLFALIGGVLLGVSGMFLFKGQLVRSALLENPEIIAEAIEQLNQNEARERLASAGDSIGQPFANAIAGNPQGDVTVVKFTDYNCGYCRGSVAEVNKLLEADSNIRIVYREMPILAESSELAARWALAAAKQGKYMDFHQAMFAEGSPSEDSIRTVAQKVGLDLEAAEAFAASDAVTRELQNNVSRMRQLGFNGTPTFIIGDQLMEGLHQAVDLQAAVDEARNNG